MKNIFLAIFITFSSSVLVAQAVKENGQLKVTGINLVNEKGETVMLRGMSFGWHNWWPRFYHAGAVSWLKKDWGCNVVGQPWE